MAISIYSNLTQNKLTQRRRDSLKKYVELIKWGRKHPVAFIEKVFKIKLMDYQAYIIEGTWTATSAVWVCSRNAGKTFLGALYLMARAVLFPQMKIRILAGVSRQSQETFTKLEDIAKKNISSLVGSSDVFLDEIVKSKADSDGFLHDNIKGWSLELYNGSLISTVKGTSKTAVSLRSNLNFYDEALNIADDFFGVTEPFAAQDKGFKTGVGLDTDILPPDIPNQIIYASSAGDVGSYLWKKYKENAIKMLMGIPGYFVVDASCELPLHPTINGVPWAPLLTQAKIDDDMKANESKAIREYYNRFDKTGGTNAAFKRSDIIKYTVDGFPVLRSEGKDHKYVIAFDPALQSDNSIILILEEYFDKKLNKWQAKLVNVKNLFEVFPDGSKRQMRTPDQLRVLRQTIVDYNGNAPDYENITLLIDAGSGGGGRMYAEYLWSDFIDNNGVQHVGMIDLADEDSKAQADKYPRAKDIVHLIEPKKMKTEMFTAAAEFVKEGNCQFLMETPRQSVITIEEDKEHVVTEEELQAFIQMDLTKEEMVSIIRTETPSGAIIYKLAPEKERRMHDDRVYTFCMGSWFISERNRAMLMDNEEKTSGFEERARSRGTIRSSASAQNKRRELPFGGLTNPFGDKKVRF